MIWKNGTTNNRKIAKEGKINMNKYKYVVGMNVSIVSG